MRLPAYAALLAATLSTGTTALAQTSDNDRTPDRGSISDEERKAQLAQVPGSPPFLILGAPVRPAPASAPAPAQRKLTLGTMPWLTGAYN